MTCPICDHTAFWPIPFQPDPQADALRAQESDAGAYEWRLCRRCGNGYPSHTPVRRVLQKLWALNRTDEDAGVAEKAARWSYRRAIAKAGAIRSYSLFAPLAGNAAGRFLDIGCGLGETVRTFAEHGWEAEGIDADPSTAQVHREIGIKARIGQFEELPLEDSYDVIHIAHAIYFITDPMRFLRLVRERLAPGGVFCVVLADFFASTDLGLPGYAHSFFPTGASMRYALALAGLETVLSRRMSGSIFIAARPRDAVALPSVSPTATRLLYGTKTLRYALIGRPYLALRRLVKLLIGRR